MLPPLLASFIPYSHFIAPAAPEQLMVESIGPSWIAFSWQQSPMNGKITGHIILISGGGMERNVTVDGAQMYTNVTELESGTEYRLRVVAVAMDGKTSPPSSILVATTTVPGTIMCIHNTRI